MKKKLSFSILFLGIFLAFLATKMPWANSLNYFAYDYFLNSSTSSPDADEIVVISIDDKSLERFEEPLVLWHKYLAEIIVGVADGKAKAIVLDLIPAISLDTLAPELDRKLIKSIRYSVRQNLPVYLGFKAGRNGTMPHVKFTPFASDLGFLNLFSDSDGKVRSQITSLAGEGGLQKNSISLLAAKSKKEIKTPPAKIYIDYRFSNIEKFPFDQAYELSKSGDLNKLRARFKNRIVLIGITSPQLPDMHSVPLISNLGSDYIPGVLIQALSIKTLLADRQLRDSPEGLNWALLLILGILSGATFLLFSPWKAGIFIAGVFVLDLFFAYKAFENYWVLPISFIIFGTIIPGVVTGVYSYILEYHRYNRLQGYFKSYVNPLVMKEIIEKPDMVSLEGDQVVATIMFTDIRSFTTLSENLTPQEVVSGLNKYFSEMTHAVTEVDGYLNRYLGDGILAVFGAPKPLPEDGAWSAVLCGFKMLQRLEELNKSEIFPGISEVQIGIGIHTGEIIVGNVGCYEKMDHTVIGDTVNLAARIESKTKEYKAKILVSESTFNRIKDRVEYKYVDKTQVKGRDEEVKLYEILSIKGDQNSEN